MKIRWLKLAAEDLEQAEVFIAQDSPSSAVRVVLRIIEAVELLANLVSVEQDALKEPGNLWSPEHPLLSPIDKKIIILKYFGFIITQDAGRTICKNNNSLC